MQNVLIYFRDSYLIAGFLLVQTVLFKQMIVRSKNQQPNSLIQGTVSLVMKNHVGELLIAPMTPKIEDATELVESVSSVRKLSSNEIMCVNFCKIIDRVLFVAFTLLYSYMVISLLPRGYLTINYEAIESLS